LGIGDWAQSPIPIIQFKKLYYFYIKNNNIIYLKPILI